MEDQVTERADPRVRAEPAVACSPAPAATQPRADRLAWIFRGSLRLGQVHPLMELVRRRHGETGGEGCEP